MKQTSFSGRPPPQAEAVSALLDGALDEAEAAGCLQSLSSAPELEQRWRAYCAVGDALRSPEVGAWHRADFCTRLHERLAAEPTVLAPPQRRPQALPRWLGGAAVAAAVAGLAFAALPLLRSAAPPAAPGVASGAAVSAPVAVAARSVAGVRRVDSYLRAHLELAGGLPPGDGLLAERAAGNRP
jgi:sigma-E factor negative regulatory protein RseA